MKYYQNSIKCDVETAKSDAETKRCRGTLFYIQELPALQFITSNTSIIITEINTDRPFGHLAIDPTVKDITPSGIFNLFETDRPNSILRLSTTKISQDNLIRIPNEAYPFMMFKSFVRDGKDLGWEDLPSEISCIPTLKLAKTFDSMIVERIQNRHKAHLQGLLTIYMKPVDELGIPSILPILDNRLGVRFIGDLLGYHKEALLGQGLRDVEVRDIERALAKLGLSLLPAAQVSSHWDNVNVEDLELSVRTANCLKINGVTTVGDILRRGEKGFYGALNFGRKSINELKEVLSEMGADFN